MFGLGLSLTQLAARNNGPSWYPGASMAINFTTDQAMSNLNNLVPSSLLSCTRASSGWASDTLGQFYEFAPNALRITNAGLIIEPERTNDVLYSINANQWATNGTTLADSGVDVTLGDISFQKVQISSTGGTWNSAIARAFYSMTSGDKVALTYYFMEGTSSKARLNIFNGTTSSYVSGNIGSLVIHTQSAGNITDLVQTSFTVGSDTIYKVTFVFEAGSSADYRFEIGPFSDTTGETVFALGAQLEAGETATSFIKTTGASATRSADIIKFSNTSWFTPTQGTWFVAWSHNQTVTGVRTLVQWDQEGASKLSSGGSVAAQIEDATPALIMNEGLTGNVPAGQHKIAVRVKQNDFAIAYNVNGTTGIATDTSGTPSATTPNDIWLNPSNSDSLDGKLSSLFFSPEALSDTVLQDLVTS